MFEKFQQKKKIKIVVQQAASEAESLDLPIVSDDINRNSVDSLTVDKVTPMPTAVLAEKEEPTIYAGFFVRLWASLMDAWIAYAITILVAGPGICLLVSNFLYGYLPDCFGHYREELVAAIGYASWFLCYIIPSWLYVSFFEGSRFRATPAKILFNLKVQDTEGKPYTFWRSTWRLLLTLAVVVIPCICLTAFIPVVGVYLCPCFQLIVYGAIFASRKKQTLYDKISQRVVVAPETSSFFLHLPKRTVVKAAALSAVMIVTTIVMAVLISWALALATAGPAYNINFVNQKNPPNHIIGLNDLVLRPFSAKTSDYMAVDSMVGNVNPPRFLWEVLGKRSSMASNGIEISTLEYLTQSGVGYRSMSTLPEGHVLQLSDLAKVEMKGEDTPYSTVSDSSLLIGRKLAVRVEKGTLLRAQMIDWR